MDCVVVYIADSCDFGHLGGFYCPEEGAHFDTPDSDSLVVATGGEVLRARGQGETVDGSCMSDESLQQGPLVGVLGGGVPDLDGVIFGT